MSNKTQHDRALHINKGVTAPSLTDVITLNGSEFDLSGSTAKFRMRPALVQTLKVDAVATPLNQTTNKGGIQYDWISADLDTEGIYYFWWRVTLPNTSIIETPERQLVVDGHTPGQGVTVGEVFNRVRGHIPNSMTALSQDGRYGDIRIQQKIDVVKWKLFHTAIDPVFEATSYNPLVLDYLGKRATLEIIPAAVDYWTDNPETVTSTGTDEIVSYPDRIDALWKIYDRLTIEVDKLEPEVIPYIPLSVTRRARAAVDTRKEDMVTSDPENWGKAFGDPWSVNPIPWGPVQ